MQYLAILIGNYLLKNLCMTTVLLFCFHVALYMGQVFLLWVLADFITGLVHWWQDTYGNPTWPIVGKYIVVPNLNHHKNPRGMVKDGYWFRVGASVVGASILIIIFYVCGWHSWRMVLCLAFASQGNQIHVMAHRTKKENGRIVLFLQRVGIFQGKKTHGWHHKAPYDTNMFIMTEFLNPLFNKIRFWERLEGAIETVFSIKPLRGAAIRGGV